MKKYLLPLALLFVCYNTYSQKKAVTEDGEEVLLYDDNTWKFVESVEIVDKPVPINPTIYTKAKTSSFLLKSTKANIGIWLNPKKWQIKKSAKNEEAEFEFQLKDGDLYGMLLSEKIEIPIESLKNIAFENGKRAAPDLYLVKEEYRTVNGKKVLLMQMNGTIKGIKFVYYGYYYSNEKGTVQFVTYTSQSLLSEQLENAEEFLNGLVTLD